MKKTGIVLLISLGLLGCATPQKSIPLMIYDMNDPYMANFEDQIIDESKGLFEVVTYDATNSQIIQNEQVDQLMKKNDVIIINPVDRLSVFSILEKAKLNHNKIIFFNREPLISDLETYDQVYYVGADAIQSAILQASLIMDLFGDDPRLNQFDKNNDHIIQAVLLKGEQGHQDAEARTQYVVSSLMDAGYQIQLLEMDIDNWDRNIAKDSTLTWLKAYGDQIELIISNNDAMALGAIDALKEQNMIQDTNGDGRIDNQTEPWLPVVGIDGLDEAVESIRSGYLYGTIVNDSQAMAKVIVELAEALQEGNSLDALSLPITDGKYIWIDYQKLTLEGE